MTLSSIIGAVALLSQLAIARPANQNQAKRQDSYDMPDHINPESTPLPEVETLTITDYVEDEVTQTIVEVTTVVTGTDEALTQIPTATADELTDIWSLYTSIEGSVTTMAQPTPSEADIIFTPLPMPYGTHSSVFPTELPWCESVSTESVTQTIYVVISNNATYTSTAETEYTETSPLPWDTVIDPFTSDIVTATDTDTDTDTWTTMPNDDWPFTQLPTHYSYSTQESWTKMPEPTAQTWTSWHNMTSSTLSTKAMSMGTITATASAHNVSTITKSIVTVTNTASAHNVSTITKGMTNVTNTAGAQNLTTSTKTLHYTTVTWTIDPSATATNHAATTITTVIDGSTIVTVTPTTTEPPITVTLPDTTTTLHITSTVIDPGMPPQETPTVISTATSNLYSILPSTTSAAAEGNVVTVTVDKNGHTLTNTATATTLMMNSSSSGMSMPTPMTSHALSSANAVTVTVTVSNTITTAVAAATPICRALGSPRPGADTDGTLLGIYWYNKPDEVVTLQGCYQLCLIGLAANHGCVAYEYYYYKSGGARCKMYGASVADTIDNSTTTVAGNQTTNSSEVGIWYDVMCGDPFATTPMAVRVPVN